MLAKYPRMIEAAIEFLRYSRSLIAKREGKLLSLGWSSHFPERDDFCFR
jgi:hypothetical protein